MKTSILLILAGLFGLLLLPGCYTQVATHEDESGYSAAPPQQQGDDTSYTGGGGEEYNGYDNTYNGGYDNGWRPQYGFSYYYPGTYWPSAGFAWQYDNLWTFYGGYYYDPFVCGTPYVAYPVAYGGYYPAYASYGYGHHGYGYGYGYTYGGSYGHRAALVNRAVGGSNRGNTGRGSNDYVPAGGGGAPGTNMDLPTGNRVSRPAAGPTRSVAPANGGRVAGAQRGTPGVRSDGRVSRAPGSRGTPRVGGGARGAARNTNRQYRLPSAPSAPSGGGSSGAPSMQPAPGTSAPPRSGSSAAPAPSAPRSAPAPASGGRTDSRGRRP